MPWPAFDMTLRPRDFTPTETDIRIKVAQQKAAIERMWVIIASILAFLLVVRVLRLVFSLLFAGRPSANEDFNSSVEKLEKNSCPELVLPGRTGKASWRRIPAAIASGFRVVVFRVQVPLGVGGASIAELFFILGYIATMLALTFTNSRSSFTLLTSVSDVSAAHNSQKSELLVLRGPRSTPRLLSAPIHCRTGWEEQPHLS